MRKKILSIIIAITCVLSFVACSAAQTKQTIEESTVAVEKEQKLVKFGLIALHDDQSTYDANFIKAAKAAAEAKGVELVIKTGVPESNECYEAAADLVDRGCNLIFADSFGHENFVIQAAKEFPDVEFSHATGTQAHTVGLTNFHNAFAAIYQGRYLAGVAGGLKLKELVDAGAEPKVGYIGAFTYAEVISGLTSWYLGVKSVVPEVTMDVIFTGSWYDEALEKEAANTLISRGCVLISQHADSMGAPTACEEAGIPNVSYNGSTVDACSNTFIIASRINWQPYFEYMIDCVASGTAIDTDWTGTIENGAVVLTDINDKVAAKETKEVIDGVKSAIINKTLNVFDTSKFTVSGNILNEYKADVDTDENYTPDTDVVHDGYFDESTFRSAPYFDIQIDGITFVNSAF